ncbi:MAG: hypothetical protein K2M70_02615 [Lachnospiraceae bacterium]|nr:hypothetical protein [Lachnospiraceae bacterium]
MAKKNTKGIIIGVIAACAAIGALTPDKEAESTEVSVPAYQAEYDIDTEDSIDDSTPDEDAAKAEEERLAKEAEEKAAKEAEEKKQAEEQAAREAEEQKAAEEQKLLASQSEKTALQETSVAAQSEPAQPQETAVVEEPSAPEESTPTPVGEMVWLSATGDKYHSINNCGRMNPNKARQVSLEDAISDGYGRCSKCW